MTGYEVTRLTHAEIEQLRRVYADLMDLSNCAVPSIRASARASVAHIAQALNGQGLAFELYTGRWDEA
jgi:hypothetical protein